MYQDKGHERVSTTRVLLSSHLEDVCLEPQNLRRKTLWVGCSHQIYRPLRRQYFKQEIGLILNAHRRLFELFPLFNVDVKVKVLRWSHPKVDEIHTKHHQLVFFNVNTNPSHGMYGCTHGDEGDRFHFPVVLIY